MRRGSRTGTRIETTPRLFRRFRVGYPGVTVKLTPRGERLKRALENVGLALSLALWVSLWAYVGAML